jgi:hypothetical protein
MTDTVKKNVVNLGDYDQMRRGLGNGPGTQALRQIRDFAGKRLEHFVERMMEQIDDALFARAEKAENNMVQTQYFDAMRELRIIRKDIESDFINGFCDRFNQGVPRNGGDSSSLSLNFDDDSSIGLVDKNDMEEELAISNMINKTRGTCTRPLYSLDKRIGFLIRDPDLERWQNPLGPEAVCESFKDAVQRIETGLEIRLVIFKLFDQHVVCHMNELYKELNQQLVKLGVMPEIKATVRKSSHSAPLPSAPTNGSDISTGYDAAPGDVTSQGHYSPAGNYAAYGGYGQSAGAGMGGMPTSLSALTFLQQGGEMAEDSEAGGFSVDPAALASGQVNILHGMRQSPIIKELGKAGDTTIDIIAMMFDYILDDKSVPNTMRALIGRLQIPILKVALMDKEFFSKKSHPARQLLNRLAATAMEWNEEQGNEDPFYQKISGIVQTILDEFEENISLFETVLEDFEDFLKHEEERAEVRAERSARVMEGQEKLEVAKSTTLEEIEPRLNKEDNSEFVREFVTNHWKNLLFITCARQGKGSEAWNQAVATMDDLIWSVKPKHTMEDRKRLVAMQPVLLGNLRAGMERLSIPPTERDDFIARLVHAHGRTAVNREDTAPDDTQQDTTSAGSAEVTSGEDRVASPEHANDEVHSNEEETDHTGSGETTRVTTSCTGDETTIDDDASKQVRRLITGTWMEFRGADGKPVRAKLSWISPITNTYLFTDRKGLKAGNYAMEELAELIRGARARVIDSKAPLMDRAVNSVLSDYNKH